MSAGITQESVQAPHVCSQMNVEAVMGYYVGPWGRGDVGILDSLPLVSALGALVRSS